jgi:hypothetical protein
MNGLPHGLLFLGAQLLAFDCLICFRHRRASWSTVEVDSLGFEHFIHQQSFENCLALQPNYNTKNA